MRKEQLSLYSYKWDYDPPQIVGTCVQARQGGRLYGPRAMSSDGLVERGVAPALRASGLPFQVVPSLKNWPGRGASIAQDVSSEYCCSWFRWKASCCSAACLARHWAGDHTFDGGPLAALFACERAVQSWRRIHSHEIFPHTRLRAMSDHEIVDRMGVVHAPVKFTPEGVERQARYTAVERCWSDAAP